MKVDFYVDVFEGIRPDCLMATTTPFTKTEGVRRYKMTTNIPDYAFTGVVDSNLPIEDLVEVDKDE